MATQSDTPVDIPDDHLSDYLTLQHLGSQTSIVRPAGQTDTLILRKLGVGDQSEADRSSLMTSLSGHQAATCHQNLSSTDTIFTQGDHVCLLSQYCEGGSLHSLITRAKSYDEVLNYIEVLDWLVQLVLALNHLHKQNLTHGRLNTQNILLKNNSVKLLESEELHGLYSKYKGEENSNKPLPKDLTTTCVSRSVMEQVKSNGNDTTCASPGEDTGKDTAMHVPPEVLQGDTYTDKSDMWGVGCIMYELCARRKLLKTTSSTKTRSKKEEGSLPVFPAELFSEELEQLWRTLMQPDPGKRPSSEDVLNLPFIVEHREDMQECQEKWSAKEYDELSCYSETCDTSLDGTPITDDVDTDIDDDAILTEEDAFHLLLSLHD